MKRPLFIYGAPASGKTTLAFSIARSLGVEAHDLDEAIERERGETPAEIIRNRGQAHFRKVERETLEKLVAKGAKLIALGGGTLTDMECRRWVEKRGAVICLDTPDEATLKRRIKKDGASKRPLGDQSKARAKHYASFTRRLTASFSAAGSLILVGKGFARAFIEGEKTVVDERVAKLYRLKASLATVKGGDKNKTPKELQTLWRRFAEKGVRRNEVVWAVGGGVTGDLTGFSAATWMRGIKWVNVPTTLLAMIDASVGGKTACDLESGKNLVGAFHAPSLVLIDTDFLATLSPRLLADGKAEMIKHAIIGGKHLLPKTLSAAELAENLKVKLRIVRRDPYETKGLRGVLNCGHTIAHALEAASGYKISHGAAVAIGCVEEARLAVQWGLSPRSCADTRGLSPRSWPEELAEVFAEAGLKTDLPKGITLKKLSKFLRKDKKNATDGKINYYLPLGWHRLESNFIVDGKE